MSATHDADIARLEDLLAKTGEALGMLTRKRASPVQIAPIRKNLVLIHLRLSGHLVSARRLVEAEGHAQTALSIDPGSRDGALQLARILLGTERPAEALDVLLPAVSGRQDDAELAELAAHAHDRTALKLETAGQVNEALGHLRQAVALKPDAVHFLTRYAAVCNDAGELDTAREAFGRLVQMVPGRGHFWRMLGLLHDFGADEIAKIEEVLSTAADRPEDARDLHFALFRALETGGDHAKAFEHLAAANQLLAQALNYREDVSDAILGSIERLFTPENRQRFASSPTDVAPIFIVGMPRSGSTLVEQILSSHPDVAGNGETPAFAALVEKHLLQTDLGFRASPLCDPDFLARFGRDYLSALGADGSLRTVDKYLSNFMWIGVIKKVFPNARIVHCRRNPLANCFSIYASYFATQGLGYNADLAATARHYVRYERLMSFWRELFPGDILDLSYEALTADQEGETRRLLAHCGLEWNEACMAFHKTDRAVKTLSFAQVRQPIYSGIDRRTGHYIDQLGPAIAELEAAGLYPG